MCVRSTAPVFPVCMGTNMHAQLLCREINKGGGGGMLQGDVKLIPVLQF